jgi:hypothetical protein
MTFNIVDTGGGPGTHVLIIGVGYYLHLRGGPDERKRSHFGLGVLDSPVISAIRLAQWMIGEPGNPSSGLHNPEAPLATMEVLVSAKVPQSLSVAGGASSVERASLQNTKNAFRRWHTSVKSHPDNVGILYFCGHGLTAKTMDQVLLLDDHGEDEETPFSTGSFDWSNTRRALLRQVRAQLYLFIDACQDVSRMASDVLGSPPQPLLSAGTSTNIVNRGDTLVESSSEGTLSYGTVGQVSRFADVLLRALGGYCGTNDPNSGNWWVNGSALSQALPKLMAIVNKERGGEPQACSPRSTGFIDSPMHVSANMPKVQVEIELNPEHHRTTSTFSVQRQIPASHGGILSGHLSNGTWQAEAQKGVYSIDISSPQHQPFNSINQFFEPPLYHRSIKVKP